MFGFSGHILLNIFEHFISIKFVMSFFPLWCVINIWKSQTVWVMKKSTDSSDQNVLSSFNWFVHKRMCVWEIWRFKKWIHVKKEQNSNGFIFSIERWWKYHWIITIHSMLMLSKALDVFYFTVLFTYLLPPCRLCIHNVIFMGK